MAASVVSGLDAADVAGRINPAVADSVSVHVIHVVDPDLLPVLSWSGEVRSHGCAALTWQSVLDDMELVCGVAWQTPGQLNSMHYHAAPEMFVVISGSGHTNLNAAQQCKSSGTQLTQPNDAHTGSVGTYVGDRAVGDAIDKSIWQILLPGDVVYNDSNVIHETRAAPFTALCTFYIFPRGPFSSFVYHFPQTSHNHSDTSKRIDSDVHSDTLNFSSSSSSSSSSSPSSSASSSSSLSSSSQSPFSPQPPQVISMLRDGKLRQVEFDRLQQACAHSIGHQQRHDDKLYELYDANSKSANETASPRPYALFAAMPCQDLENKYWHYGIRRLKSSNTHQLNDTSNVCNSNHNGEAHSIHKLSSAHTPSGMLADTKRVKVSVCMRKREVWYIAAGEAVLSWTPNQRSATPTIPHAASSRLLHVGGSMIGGGSVSKRIGDHADLRAGLVVYNSSDCTQELEIELQEDTTDASPVAAFTFLYFCKK